MLEHLQLLHTHVLDITIAYLQNQRQEKAGPLGNAGGAAYQAYLNSFHAGSGASAITAIVGGCVWA